MSVRVLSRVLHGSSTKLAARLVLISLADSAHDDGVTWIGQKDLAEVANISQAHAREMLRELEEVGAIETRKAQRGRRRINVYRVMCAPADVDYDRLPFVLSEPFSTTAEIPRSSEDDDRGSTDLTTADLPTIDDPGYIETRATTGLNRKRTRNLGDSVSSEGEAPRPVLVDGRNLGFDALADVCGYHPERPQDAAEIAVALNGSRNTGPGIRAELWAEDVASGWDPAAIVDRRGPELWEERIATVIRDRADLYRRRMPGATMTPTALAKWWGRLPSMPDPAGARVTAASLLERTR